MNRSKATQPVTNPMDFFGGTVTTSSDDDLTPGIRPASDILDEIQRAVAAMKGRKGAN